jgi:hypothetical protein
MDKAIKLAIEGGWQGLEWHDEIEVEKGLKYPLYARVWGRSKEGEGHGTQVAFIVLDPSFWQALGKAMGWSGKVDMKFINAFGNTIVFTDLPRWEMHWHKFIHHIAEGKDADSFFQELLAPHTTNT